MLAKLKGQIEELTTADIRVTYWIKTSFLYRKKLTQLCLYHGLTKYGIHSLTQIALAMDKELNNSAPDRQWTN